MAGRRNRVGRSSRLSSELKKTNRRIEQNKSPLQGGISSASHAPYGFTVSGALNGDSATFSSAVTVNNGVTVTTTSAALTVPRMTTTQRNALTAAVGMIIYNTTDSKFQGYAGSSWVNLH
jgi:hypothetical protein